MFSFFKKKTKAELLQKKYYKLLKESQKLSLVNRMASYEKAAEADLVMQEIDKLQNET